MNQNQSQSRALLDRVMRSGSCSVWSYWPICLYWQWYWGGNPVSRPAPARHAALLVSLLFPAIIFIICSVLGSLPSLMCRMVEIILLPSSQAHCLRSLWHMISLASMHGRGNRQLQREREKKEKNSTDNTRNINDHLFCRKRLLLKSFEISLQGYLSHFYTYQI